MVEPTSDPKSAYETLVCAQEFYSEEKNETTGDGTVALQMGLFCEV